MNAHTLKTLAGPIAILLLLTLTALLARPATPIDETRYLSVAWEMWLKGDYLVLFKNGELYSHKPPLLFWLYNLGWAVFGVNDWWPRLVSPLFSLGGLLLTLAIARRLWPGEWVTQGNALWILGASLLWMVFSTLAMFDVMLAFFVLLGMRGLLIAADGSLRRGFAWLALAIGMGVLAKGPVVLLHLLPAAMLAPWWKGRDGTDWKRWYGGILLAVAAGAMIALAWAIPAAIQGVRNTAGPFSGGRPPTAWSIPSRTSDRSGGTCRSCRWRCFPGCCGRPCGAALQRFGAKGWTAACVSAWRGWRRYSWHFLSSAASRFTIWCR